MKDNTRMFAGIDIGDRYSEICLLDAQGEIVERRRIATASSSLTKYFSPKVPLTVALETCSHSSWMNETLSELGATVVVANARKVALIAKNNTKSDKIDAELLARLARSDVKLLSPVTHQSRASNSWARFVRVTRWCGVGRAGNRSQRREVIGCRLPTKSAASFICCKTSCRPRSLRILPLMASIHALTTQIKAMDKSIAQTDEHYPIAGFLREIHGVGPVTSLAFVLTISDPERFRRNRDVVTAIASTTAAPAIRGKHLDCPVLATALKSRLRCPPLMREQRERFRDCSAWSGRIPTCTEPEKLVSQRVRMEA